MSYFIIKFTLLLQLSEPEVATELFFNKLISYLLRYSFFDPEGTCDLDDMQSPTVSVVSILFLLQILLLNHPRTFGDDW